MASTPRVRALPKMAMASVDAHDALRRAVSDATVPRRLAADVDAALGKTDRDRSQRRSVES